MKSFSITMMVWAVALTMVLPFSTIALAQDAPVEGQVAPTSAVFKQEELDQLLAPIALYPDAIVAQILMASTYPLEVVQAARWLKDNPNVTGSALEDALQKQSWDPSVKSLTALPQVLNMMNENLDWTQKLGDAFLAQGKQVMDTIQGLRAKADAAGNLKSSKEQKVSSEQVANQTIIKIMPANPQVIYVPTYNPTVVYGTWPYPAYPPYYYYPPGYVAGTALFSFAMGAAIGSWMWGNCNWRHGSVDVHVNHYNNFNRTNIRNSNWQHNASHRRGVAYRDRGTAQRFDRDFTRDAQTREAFRGRAEQGRQELRRGDAGRSLGASPGTRDRISADRGHDHKISAAGTRDLANAGRGRDSIASQRQQRDYSGGRRGAFDGVGNAAQTRQYSNRGHASRQSMAASRRSGGGFGGARGGGGRRR